MLLPVINRLPCCAEVRFVRNGCPCIRISIETRKIAARYFQPNTMAGQKHVARHPCIDFDAVNRTRFREFRLFEAVPVSEPENTIRQVARVTVREDVHQFCRKVGIRSARRDE
jgi:hypothetical protein